MTEERAGVTCPGLSRVLSRVLREDKPEVLDLGPMCGESVVYLATRGARVHVEEFDPPPPTPPREPGEPPPEKPPLRLAKPDGAFDLVLAWELIDFVPPDRIADFGAELDRVLRDGAWALVFSHSHPDSENDPLARYRILDDDRVSRELCELPPRRRWVHPTREIERALSGFSIQGIHLQRTQMREIAALKAGLVG